MSNDWFTFFLIRYLWQSIKYYLRWFIICIQHYIVHGSKHYCLGQVANMSAKLEFQCCYACQIYILLYGCRHLWSSYFKTFGTKQHFPNLRCIGHPRIEKWCQVNLYKGCPETLMGDDNSTSSSYTLNLFLENWLIKDIYNRAYITLFQS